MSKETTDSQDYKPGWWGCIGIVSFGGCGTLIAIPIGLLGAGFFCLLGSCWMANNSGWALVILGIVGFLIGMSTASRVMESSFKKKQDEERRRRLEQAQLRWLEEQERRNQ